MAQQSAKESVPNQMIAPTHQVKDNPLKISIPKRQWVPLKFMRQKVKVFAKFHHHPVCWETMILDVFPRKTTNTAEYAAVAVKTSCLLAFVNIEHEAEKASVNKKTVRIWKLLLRRNSACEVGWSLKRTKTGTRSRTAAIVVNTIRSNISKRWAERRLSSSSPVLRLCSELRKIA